jgi:cellulose synthase/poly-beta-1,6-N-acetylglucosamine synthase-like glycosyltransferase
MPPANPFISIVVPIRNEEATIERLTRSLLDQNYPHDRYEILMADGGSTDRTRELLAVTDVEARVRVLDNPGRTAPAALNVAIAEAKGDIVTRVDGHSYVAPDYLSRIVAVMEETGESVVGGPVLMFADTPFRKALVEALYSKVGVGAVPYRTLQTRSYVESLQTGSFKKAVLDRVGPFDEALAVVEDLDMNTRIRKSGYKLLLDPSIRFWYLPRPTLRALWRQIFAVGLVKVRILRKHPDIFKWKYVLPSVLVAALAAALALAAGGVTAGLAFVAAYAVVIVAFALSRVPRLGAGALRLVAIVPTLHVGYGLGFFAGLSETVLGRSSRSPGAP